MQCLSMFLTLSWHCVACLKHHGVTNHWPEPPVFKHVQTFYYLLRHFSAARAGWCGLGHHSKTQQSCQSHYCFRAALCCHKRLQTEAHSSWSIASRYITVIIVRLGSGLQYATVCHSGNFGFCMILLFLLQPLCIFVSLSSLRFASLSLAPLCSRRHCNTSIASMRSSQSFRGCTDLLWFICNLCKRLSFRST